MYLFISSPRRGNSTLILVKNENVVEKKKLRSESASRNLLKSIDGLLKKNNVPTKKITGIAVNQGPGQFSALRTGVVIANTMGFTLNIPVVGVACEQYSDDYFLCHGLKKLSRVKKFHPILPLYGSEPNITSARSVPRAE